MFLKVEKLQKCMLKQPKNIKKMRLAKRPPNTLNLHTERAKKVSQNYQKHLTKRRQKSITKKDANLKS